MSLDGQLPDIAPRVSVCTVDGQYVRLRRTAAGEVMGLLEDLGDPDVETLSFDLDDGRSQVHVRREAVVRIDVDWELSRWQRGKAWLLERMDRWL